MTCRNTPRWLWTLWILGVVQFGGVVFAHDDHGHGGHGDLPLPCDESIGEACYYALIDDFHANPSTTDSTGEIWLTMNPARDEVQYLIQLDDLLGLKPNPVDRAEPDDILGMHLHLHVPDAIGPHLLNLFGLATPTLWGEEDADLVVDYEHRTLRGRYDLSDATLDPETGEPYPQFFFATSKIVTDWVDHFNEGLIVIAVHTVESGFANFALHGHIARVVPEPGTGVAGILGLGCLLFGRRNSQRPSTTVDTPQSTTSRWSPGGRPLHRALWSLAALAALAPTATRADVATEGDWANVMTWGQAGGVEAIHTFLLPTGKVLFWSSWKESVGLWNPVTNQFSSPGNFASHNIFCSGHAWLPDGRLLVAGGHVQNYNGENRADIFDPFTERWANADPAQANVPNMGSTSTNTASSGKRWYPSATTLGNGDVLLLSGDVTQLGNTNRTVQVYQHQTNSWANYSGALRPTNDLLPEYPRVFLGPDGRAVSLSDYNDDTEFLDLTGAGSWSYLEDTLDSNLHNYGPAVMYDTGKIAYIGGGNNPTRNISILDLNEAEPEWRYAGGGRTPHAADAPFVMSAARRQNNATILADGTVLITGGTSVVGWNDPNGLIAAAEIWDPVTEEVHQVADANVNIYRGYHSTGLLLPDGRVLITGGDHDYGGAIPGQNTNAEIYSPAYLFAEDGSPAVRPTISAAPDVVELGDTIFVETPDAGSIAKALWVVPGAVTHAQNWTQRANVLEFSADESGVHIALPADWNEAPVGYYMLFLVNDQGTPSLAQWVRAVPNELIPGDFNGDDVVDAADYTVWREGVETGLYTPDDYDLWVANYGASQDDAQSAAVPEPAALVLGALALLTRYRRSRRRTELRIVSPAARLASKGYQPRSSRS
jgi:hypothetical protein